MVELQCLVPCCAYKPQMVLLRQMCVHYCMCAPPPPFTTPALLVPVFSTKLAGCLEKEERGNECKIFLHNGPS